MEIEGEPPVNIRQIEVFKAVMDAGSVTGAARRLNISQPSVSKHLRQLEERLGIRLFVRMGNRLTPKPEAHALFDQVERVYRGLDHLSRFAENLSHYRQGEILVAAMPLIAHRWLPRFIAAFLHRHPDVSVSLPVRSSQWISQWVAAARVDLGIGMSNGDEPGILREPLMELPLVCVMPPYHRLAQRGTIEPRDLDGESLITLSNFSQYRLAVEQVLESHGVAFRRRVDTFTTYVAAELARQGVGVAIIDMLTAAEFAQDGLVSRPFKPLTSFQIYLLRPAHRPGSGLTEHFIQELQMAAAQFLGAELAAKR